MLELSFSNLDMYLAIAQCPVQYGKYFASFSAFEIYFTSI